MRLALLINFCLTRMGNAETAEIAESYLLCMLCDLRLPS